MASFHFGRFGKWFGEVEGKAFKVLLAQDRKDLHPFLSLCLSLPLYMPCLVLFQGSLQFHLTDRSAGTKNT